MARKNKLLEAPPYMVEQALKRLGTNLRTARLRRNLTIQDVAAKIGTGPRAISIRLKRVNSKLFIDAIFLAIDLNQDDSPQGFKVWDEEPTVPHAEPAFRPMAKPSSLDEGR